MKTQTCTNCGEQLEPGWDTCPACTSAVSTSNNCRSCGRELKPNWKICPYCKTPYSGSAASGSASSRSGFTGAVDPIFTEPEREGHSTAHQSELPPGTLLRDYRIESLLGRGALSTVYKVQNTQLDETLALKVVASYEKKHPLIEAYKDEYKAQRAIVDKSHILHCEAPQVHHHTDDITYLMLPMELAHESLKDWMQRHPADNELRLKRGLELFKQACMGVEAIHKQGLVHLDLKPGNILLTGDPENPVVKIADFGLSRSMQKAGQRQALYRDGIGTPAYMAPEQILAARWKDVGKEADLYALGMIVYELLDGDLPYSGSAEAIKEKKRDASIEISPPQGSPYLSEVVMACLNRDKKKRLVSAMALITQLDEKRKQERQEKQKQETERKRLEQVNQQVTSLLQQAQTAYTAGRLDQALEILGRVLNLDPNNAQAIASKKAVTKEVAKQEAEKKRQEQEAEQQRRKKAEAERKQREAEALRKRQEAEHKRHAEEEQKRKEQERLKNLAGDFVFVQGGTFMMGNEEGESREQPVHEVELDDFYIGTYPVTQAQWQAVMGSNPSWFKGDNHPVQSVSWEDAQAFIRKLNDLTGKTFRLPTEAEWEYAARGGQKSRGYRYAGSDNLHDVGWFEENSDGQPHPVGRKRPNELGIYDMSGNVCEWCNDRYDYEYYQKSPRRNPQGPASGEFRLYRGGSWYYEAAYCGSAYRNSNTPGSKGTNLGFRLACSFR
jgi:formylglycine-generating enzyme required for sulfatase activity/serine/threonine protein kinase/RNA polymerase subunit RPABC4/transcription elongation factor Spt4